MPATRLSRRRWAVLAAAVALLAALALPAASGARSRGPRYVTADYTGTWDELFAYDPSDPADWQESMHFAWDEHEVAAVGRPHATSVRVISRTLTISGSKRSSYAPPNAARSCTGSYAVKPHHRWPLAILSGPAPRAGDLHLNVSAIAPLDAAQFATASGTGDCATIRTPASPPTSRWSDALTPLADFYARRHHYVRRFDTVDGDAAQGAQVIVHATLTASVSSRPPPPKACAAARLCGVCPNPSDDGVRARFERALDDTGASVDELPDLHGFHAARVKLLAAVNAASPRTDAAELGALHGHEGAYEARIRRARDRQAAKLRADERRWLARARCPATRRAIEEGFAAPRENLEHAYRRAQRYVEYLTHAITAHCGCGGVKRAVPAAKARRLRGSGEPGVAQAIRWLWNR